MSLFGKSISGIIREACKAEGCVSNEECDDCQDDEIEQNVSDTLDGTDELDFDIEYTEEMVNVIYQESAGTYLIELDNLTKFMESSGLEVREAMEAVCEHNNIKMGDTCLVIESDESFREYLEEAKKSKKKKQILKNTDNLFKGLTNKGIRVAKKKSRKKKK